ncbi:hypothetical protein ANO14919_078700 [Xylariales sp. No.14919]|nr:hypothetical protein ANO14919_078700 [Xylariales sp. No.14919]
MDKENLGSCEEDEGPEVDDGGGEYTSVGAINL